MRVTEVAVSVEAPSLFEKMMNERSQQGDVELLTKDGVLWPFIYEAAEAHIAGMQYWISVGFVNSKLYEKVGQLEQALLSRVVIEQAKGVLVGRHRMTRTPPSKHCVQAHGRTACPSTISPAVRSRNPTHRKRSSPASHVTP